MVLVAYLISVCCMEVPSGGCVVYYLTYNSVSGHGYSVVLANNRSCIPCHNVFVT